MLASALSDAVAEPFALRLAKALIVAEPVRDAVLVVLGVAATGMSAMW
jgi:hypothetical protein